jgi:hypothetical protein
VKSSFYSDLPHPIAEQAEQNVGNALGARGLS